MRLILKVVVPDAPSREIKLDCNEATIGRDPACEIAFDEHEASGVSWIHARLENGEEDAILRDFGSTNGTHVNGQQISSPTVISEGDAIQLGQNGPKIVVLKCEVISKSEQALAERNAIKGRELRRVENQRRNMVRMATSPATLASAAAVVVGLFLVSTIWWAQPSKVAAPTIPPPPPPIDLEKWAKADLILTDQQRGAVALSTETIGQGLYVRVIDRTRSREELEEALSTAWASNVPILENVAGLAKQVLKVPPDDPLPDYIQQQIVSLFPAQPSVGVGELVEFRDRRGWLRIGYQTKTLDDGIEFRPLNRATATRVVQPSSLRKLTVDDLRIRSGTPELVVHRTLEALVASTKKPQFRSVAISYGADIAPETRNVLEQLFGHSPMQWELRPNLIDFQSTGKKSWNRIDLATAKRRQLLGTTHLLQVTASNPIDDSANLASEFRLVELSTGNTLWTEHGSNRARGETEESAAMKAMADMPYLLHSGTLSFITFQNKDRIPPQLNSVVRGPFAANDYRVALVEDRDPAKWRIRPLFASTEILTVEANEIREFQDIDPDALLAATNKFDPQFASWRIARHLLPPAGRITRIDAPLVEIDLGRKYGPQVGREFIVQRLPAGNELSRSYLPIRLRVVEARPTLTVAEIVSSKGDGDELITDIDEPKVGDVAILMLMPRHEDEETKFVAYRKPKVALLQIRTATQGTNEEVGDVPVIGPFIKATQTQSKDLRNYYALRLANELEAVLIHLECDVADHHRLWLRPVERERLGPNASLPEIVVDLCERMQVTHVVLADLVTVPTGSHQNNYVGFSVTEMVSTSNGPIGRLVEKLEIEFPQ